MTQLSSFRRPIDGLPLSAGALIALTAVAALLATVGCGSGGPNTGGGGMNGGGMGGAAAGACTPSHPTAPAELQGRFGVAYTESAGKEYVLQVNQWNQNATGGVQTMAWGGDFFFKMTAQPASAPTNGGPTGFPSQFTGANNNHATSDSNLPKRVGDLTTVPTSWTWNDAGTLTNPTNNSYNATYDVWFGLGADGELSATGPSAGFLMVWYYKPPDAQPIGSIRYTSVSIPGVPGTWDVWIGPNGGKPVTSYVANTHILTLSFDLNAFIQDAVTKRQYNGAPAVSADWYLTNIFAGFEIWRGGVNLESTNFCAVVN